ncbi:hypothetical protein LZ554_001954 [Drepanopeziza brunnea f. sp. 'monogermtubi']|nr:hypothetical protein LZ554_001954 [Drepanopeziza brunnea f. sp. 'monogermtubi']
MADLKVNSVADAKAHISQIRHDKGLLDGKPGGPNISDLENALTTLSEQLYQSSTHFLLEIIQNADDNQYSAAVPSLEFTYKKGGLRVDCNEIGFSPRNVEAICRVGQSTKKGMKAEGYVGEKGIGFKSVFKAADVVWVQSGHYSFKFDKSKPLGMISPIWDDFPMPVRPGYTSLYLKLSAGYHTSGLLEELKALDSRLLIFLRRLRSVSVEISEGGIFGNFKNSFSRQDWGEVLVRLTQNKVDCDYVIKRHRVLGMPQDKRRDGTTSSEIVLGFPIMMGEDGKSAVPKRESQQVYAFLPIRDYGFEFLIQADFLLIASREDIDSSAEWNHRIQRELTTAFIDTMREFNSSEFRYTWSRWLPTRAPLDSFLKPFHLGLITMLRSAKLLYAHDGELAAPSQLWQVPEEYCFNGAPLTISPATATGYLSDLYEEEDMEFLQVMGVSKMLEWKFYAQFKLLLQCEPKEFQEKTAEWHSHLAGVLVRLGKIYADGLVDLPIVPLSDGTWVRAKGNLILFPSKDPRFTIPGGLELQILDRAVASDPARHQLLKFMGVEELQKDPVIEHIRALHVDGRACNGSMISRKELIEQLYFLYTSQEKNPFFQDYWFVAESSRRVRGSVLYQRSTKPHSASFYLSKNSKIQFLHQDYLSTASEGGEAWMAWLEERMKVASIPRLVELTTEGGFKFSEDFEYIIKTYKSSEVLRLLRAHWKEYSKLFDPAVISKGSSDPSMSIYSSDQYIASAIRLKQKLGALLVTCTDGKMHRLDSTYLATRDLRSVGRDVPFVDIPDPDHTGWEVFEILGVSIKVDIHFHLRSLEELSKSKPSDKTFEAYTSLLETISYRCRDEVEAAVVKIFFRTGNNIYIPAIGKSPAEWISQDRCRWNGPRMQSILPAYSEKGKAAEPIITTFRTFKPLKPLYPKFKPLFWHMLDIQDANLRDLAGEARAFQPGDSLAKVTAIFKTMSKLMEEDEARFFQMYIAKDLEKVFPVSKIWKTESEVVTKIESMAEGSEWFIADTASLRTTFAGVVPLLDVKVDDLGSMDELLRELGLSKRFLRTQAKSVAKCNGNVEFNQGFTELFRRKVDFIIRLIPTTKHHRGGRRTVIRQLRNLEVYVADEVVQHFRVFYKNKWVSGPAGNGQVALAAEEDRLKIYLAAKGGCEMDSLPSELMDELYIFCGMDQYGPQHSEVCLHIALSQHDLARVARTFGEKGIPSLESLAFADEEDVGVKEDEEETPGLKDAAEKKKKGWTWKGKGLQDHGFLPTLNIENAEPSTKVPKPKKRHEVFGKHLSTGEAAGLGVATVVGMPFVLIGGIGYGVYTGFQAIKGPNKFDDEHDGGFAGRGANKTAHRKKKAAAKSKATKIKAPRIGPNGIQRFERSVSEGFIRIQRVIYASAVNKDIAFRGELAVHQTLTATLGQTYNATHHWLSAHRRLASFPSFPSPSSQSPNTHSTFKFPDPSGAFTHLLAQTAYPPAVHWTAQPPTYHIDVKSSVGGLASEFAVTGAELRRAKEMSGVVRMGNVADRKGKGKEEEGERPPRDVYILARVYDVDVGSQNSVDVDGKGKGRVNGDEGSKMLFLVDPWEYYHKERLLLRCEGQVFGSIV